MALKKKPKQRVQKPARSSERIFANSVPEAREVIAPLDFFGCVDVISHEQIAGWVWNPLDPDESLFVEIFDGDNLLVRIQADAYRGDLKSAGIGTGRYGFNLPNPSVLLPHARHRVAVRRATDGVDLPGSPQVLARSGLGLDPSLEPLLESAAAVSARLARAPEDLNHQVGFTLRLLNELLTAQRRLDESRKSAGES